MKTTEEKAYYLSLMQTALEERRELTSFIRECQARIKELNDLEKMGIGEIKTNAFIELYNAKQADKLPEPKNTIAKAASNIGSAIAAMGKGLTESAATKQINIPINQVTNEQIDALREMNKASRATTTQETAIQEEEQVEQVQEPKKKRVGGQGIDPNKMNSMIYYVMSQAGQPLHMKEIYKRLQEVYNIPTTFKNFVNNQLPKAMKANDQLIRTDRGVYHLIK